MEPISAIVLSLALGAHATVSDLAVSASAIVGDEMVRIAVKGAYERLKSLIGGRYPRVSVDLIEQVPASKARRAVVEEDLAAAGASHDAELIEAARKLIELIEKQGPSAAQAIGVDLRDVSAANLRLADIVASGTGVRVEKGTFSGDIDIRGVRAGVSTVDGKDS